MDTSLKTPTVQGVVLEKRYVIDGLLAMGERIKATFWTWRFPTAEDASPRTFAYKLKFEVRPRRSL